MKLSMIMLILGAFTAGLGVFAWQAMQTMLLISGGGPLSDGWRNFVLIRSTGIGFAVFGVILALGGLANMIRRG